MESNYLNIIDQYQKEIQTLKNEIEILKKPNIPMIIEDLPIKQESCDNVYGLQQNNNSCWFDTVIFALFFPNESYKYLITIIDTTINNLAASNDILTYKRMIALNNLKNIIDKIKKGEKLPQKCSTYLSNELIALGLDINDIYTFSSPKRFIESLWNLFDLPKMQFEYWNNIKKKVEIYDDYIFHISNEKKPTTIQNVINRQKLKFNIVSNVIIFGSVENEYLIPDNIINVMEGYSKYKYKLVSIISFKHDHFIAYSHCSEANEWFVYNGVNSEYMTTILKIGNSDVFNYFNPSSNYFYSNLYTYKTNNVVTIYDFTNNKNSSSYYIYAKTDDIQLGGSENKQIYNKYLKYKKKYLNLKNIKN